MPPLTTWTNISASIRIGILLAFGSCLLSLTACSATPVVSIILPDSKELRPAALCEWDDHMNPTNCRLDPGRATIDLGYAREIADLLDACRKKEI